MDALILQAARHGVTTTDELREFGLESNVWVSDGEKLVEVDFLWRDARLIVEIDSARYHGTRWRRRQDAAKTAALRMSGWTVLRFWDVEINGTPAQVAATILARPVWAARLRIIRSPGARATENAATAARGRRGPSL